MDKLDLNRVKAIFISPGLGKTYLANLDSRFVDVDLEHTKKTYLLSPNTTSDEVERLKGSKHEYNPNWSFDKENQIIMDVISKGKIALHAPYDECMSFLYENGVPYALIYAHPCMKRDIYKRSIKRGNQKRIAEKISSDTFMNTNFEEFESDNRPTYKIVVKKGYASDYINLD